MRKNFLLIMLTLLMATAAHGQTSPTYDEIRTKIHHIAESYLGYKVDNEQALFIVLQRLCDYYQGRMTQQQYKVIAADINMMKAKVTDQELIRMAENALQTLKSKADTLDIQQRILDYYQKVPKEQIYLHTDKSYYVPGDTVWFRAHLVDAVTHTPISRSRYVYVELLDNQADTLVQRIIVKCDSDGVFANALTLPRHLHGGGYTLAAYTQWMRNFPAERFFYKQLVVVGSSHGGNNSFPGREYDVPKVGIKSAPQGNSSLQITQRKEQLLIQLNQPTDEPLSCVLYGSGNLLVTDYTPAKVLRIDSQSLRPGTLSVAMVNRETGDIVAEGRTHMEAGDAQVTIGGQARSHNEPMELTIDMADADGAPVQGNFSLSVTDYDVVRPDTMQPDIRQSLNNVAAQDYVLSDMLSSRYPQIDYSFQTSLTISGQIRSTLFKKVKRPKLMLVRPDTGFRQIFELGDSSRFTINGLDFPDGTTYVLEGMRRTGSTSLVQLDIDPIAFPQFHAPQWSIQKLDIPEGFNKQAKEQVMFGSVDREIELPEVVKEKKRQHKPTNLMGVPPFRAFYDDDPMLNNFHSMEILLSTLGIPVYRDAKGELRIRARSGSITAAKTGPVIFIDEFRSNVEELLMLQPATIESIEWFDHVGAANMTIYGWNVSTSGLLLVRQKPGLHGRIFRPLSMATVQQQGWKPNVEFYSPQYPDKSLKTRPDHRTTLYWNPKVETDANGHAQVRFYASDISKRYLITLEGVSDDGIIVHKQMIIE